MHQLLWLSSVLLLPVFSIADEIKNLPGLEYAELNFKQYAGYFTVDTEKKYHMHYWFQESQRDPKNDPVILWLTGGPGCSGFSALLTEWGAFEVRMDKEKKTWLEPNPYAWNKRANIFTVESPINVGYSYAEGASDPIKMNDNITAELNHQAILEFFKAFPQYKNNDFYVIGESYGGKYVPTLVQRILDKNGQKESHINIVGMGLGNGCVSNLLDMNTIIQFMYHHGMVDEREWQRINRICCQNSIGTCDFVKLDGVLSKDYEKTCRKFVTDIEEAAWSSGINPYNMFAKCEGSTQSAEFQTRYINDKFYKFGIRNEANDIEIPCMDEEPVTRYLNRSDVKDALFVPKHLKNKEWQICAEQKYLYYTPQYTDMTSRVQYAIDSGVRVLVYNGDGDMVCNFMMGEQFVDKLGYQETAYKHAFYVGNQVGGYFTQYGPATFMTILGAGHMVPTDKPKVAEYMLNAFLDNVDPPLNPQA